MHTNASKPEGVTCEYNITTSLYGNMELFDEIVRLTSSQSCHLVRYMDVKFSVIKEALETQNGTKLNNVSRLKICATAAYSQIEHPPW